MSPLNQDNKDLCTVTGKSIGNKESLVAFPPFSNTHLREVIQGLIT